MKRTFLVLALLALMADVCGAWTARVKKVRDGDSVQVAGPEGVLVNLRLYGIDTPEAKQPYGPQAKKRLAELVSRRELAVENMATDQYNRTVALVRLDDGTLVNRVLVAEGLAWVFDGYCRIDICQELHELQDRARAERRGLWAEEKPMSPWDWRKEHRQQEWYVKPVRAIKSAAKALKSVLR